MAEVPKIALQRLQVAKADAHPDLDVINAFAENSLQARERERILAHLAKCADCREIAVLSLPETDASAAVVSAKSETSWLRWPALRWAAVAACAVIVGTAVTLRYETRTGPQVGVKSDAAVSSSLDKLSAPAATAPAVGQAVSSETSTSDEKKEPVRLADKFAPQKKVMPQAPAPRETDLAATAMPPAPAAAVSPDRKAKSALTTSNEVSQVQGDELQVVPGRAKDALPQPSGGAIGGVIGGMMAKERVAPSAPAMAASIPSVFVPRWTLSSDGTLQRSIDSGRTWQTVPTPGQSSFRALAASGTEIWVGGAKGALYHSSDAGAHWTQIQPIVGTQSLTADITGIEFTDSQHGSVNTVEGETWITADAGQTWSKK